MTRKFVKEVLEAAFPADRKSVQAMLSHAERDVLNWRFQRGL
jgi:hypothetical protein